jgi:hypothetical protein
MWYNRPLDAVGGYRDSAAFFQRYDRIVLSTPEIGLQDREAQKHGWIVPRYVRALELGGVPFTTALQGFDYGEKWSPFAGAVVSLPNFTGVGVAHSPASLVLNGNAALEKVTWLPAGLPFIQTGSGLPPPDIAGVTGRFCHIKGYHLMAMMAGQGLLPHGTIVKLAGTAALSNRPSISYEVWEMLEQEFGFKGTREEGNIYAPIPWSLTSDEKIVGVDYTGSYTDPLAVASGITATTCLTARKNCSGTMDYAQLESADAGCMLISTTTQWRDSFWGWTQEPLDTMPSIKKALSDATVQAWLKTTAALVTVALSTTEHNRSLIAQHNRQVLRTEHAPSAIAKVFLEALG